VYSPSSYKNGLHDFTLAVSGEHQQPTFPMWSFLMQSMNWFTGKTDWLNQKN
jgi:hypothetical protein